MKQKIKINFCDVEPRYFDVNNNFFLDALNRDYDIEISEQPDFLFYSCFGDKHKTYKNCVKIFYTNENLVPDFNECDYAIGFHYISFEDRYLRLTEYDLKLDESVQNRMNLGNEFSKRKFCNFIYTNVHNGEGAALRYEFCQKLMKYKHVDCPGKILNNMQNAITPRRGNWLTGKLEFLKNYKFTIAFENRLANGYTTEKMYQPVMADSIPIYWGNPRVVEDFNPKAFINCNDYNNLDEVIEKVIELDSDDEKYMKMLREPAMHPDYKFDGKKRLNDFLQNIIQKGNKPYNTIARSDFVTFLERLSPLKSRATNKILHILGFRIKVG